MATLKNITVSVTASTPNFTVTAGSMSDFRVGDLLYIRDPAKGTMVHQVITKNDTAKTGTFAPNYIGTTQTGLYAMIVPVSSIDPTGDTVIKTELVEAITKSFADNQANSANWQQVLSVPSGNVTVILPDGSTVTGPSWRSILTAVLQKDVPGQVFNQGLTMNGSLIIADTAQKPGNLDVAGFSRFRKGVTFDEVVSCTKDVNIVPPDNVYASLRAEQKMTATTGTVTGPSFISALNSENGNITSMLMSCRKEIGSTDYGYFSYKDFRGNWHEVRVQNNGDVNNLTGNWVTGSDRRIKDKIEEVEDPIALIRGLKLYTYERDGTPGIGGIAQEIEKTLPNLVSEGGSLELKSGPVVERVKSVDYNTMGYIAVAALNKALDRIDELEKRLAVLEAK